MLLITGKNGQLGQAVADICTSRGIAFAAFSRTELDIADREAVRRMVLPGTFDAVINCAAYTAVDAAEDNPGKAYAINACGPWNLAATGVPILHVSTDYVFDGKADEPYDVDDTPRPLGVYGLSKRAGETALLEGGFRGAVVRTAWVYSKRAGTKNFYQTIKRLSAERPTLRVVDDQLGAPTRAEDLALALVELYEKKAHLEPMKVLHFTNSGRTSWCGFARAIVEETPNACEVKAISSAEYPTKAVRPAFSVLSLASLAPYGIVPRSWQEALAAD